MDGIKQLVIVANVVTSHSVIAVPVLPAVPWVRVPAFGPVGTVQLVAAVWCWGGRLHAVLVAGVADRPVAASHAVWEVTPLVFRAVIQVVLAHVVNAGFLGAVPVLPAVVRVRVPTVSHVGTVHNVTTVWGSRRRRAVGVALLVAFVTRGTVATVNPLGIVAPDIILVKHQTVLAQDMLRPAGITVPVFAAVVGISIVSFLSPVAKVGLAVHDMTAVRGGGRGCGGGDAMGGIHAGPRPAVYSQRIGAVAVHGVKQKIAFTLEVDGAPVLAFKVAGAVVRVGKLLGVQAVAGCSVGEQVALCSRHPDYAEQRQQHLHHHHDALQGLGSICNPSSLI